MPTSFSVKVTAAIGIGLAMLLALGFVGYRSIGQFYDADQEMRWMITLWGAGLAIALLVWVIVVINRYERDRRRVESQLRGAQERLALALEGSNSAVWDWNLERDEIYLSAGWSTMLGAQAQESTTTPAELLALVHPDDLKQVQKVVQDALNGATPDYAVEHRVRRVDGDWIWILSRGKIVRRDQENRPSRMTGTNQDVTGRKRVELALGASERQLRLLTNAVPAAIGYQDSDERIRFCNQAMAKLLGLTPEAAIGRSLREVFNVETYQHIRPFALRALAGEEVHFERVQMKPQGQVDLSVAYVPHRDEQGGVDGFYALATDISELKRLDRMKSEFVSTVSHELRTPLTSIRGALGVLAGGVAGPLPDKARQFIEIAKNNCERLIRLINDILDMEKIESGKMAFQLAVLDLTELIEQVVKANEAFAAQHKVRLQVIDARPGTKVYADSDRLAQVLTNFVSNACKFSPADSTVDISVVCDDERVRVGVVDHGPGISEGFRQRIFQKFSQADSSDGRQKGGTGLGLSISKAIVEGLGGAIGFETEAAKGSTFYFYLPEWHEPVAAGATGSSGRPRILVCEDDADVGKLLRIMVDRAGYDADLARSAAEAKTLMRERRYAAITLDLGLPDQDGLALLRELRADAETASVPVIVVSAVAQEGKLKIGSEPLGVVDWLSKPIDEERLLADLRSAVSAGERRLRVLHVEDDADVRSVVASLARDFADFDAAETVAQACAKLRQGSYDLVLLDLGLPDGSGWKLLPLIETATPRPRVVIFSAQDADPGRKASASTFLVKSQISEQQLIAAIKDAVTGPA